MWRCRSRIFRRSPALYGADRGFFSENNLVVCVRGGIAHNLMIIGELLTNRSRPRRKINRQTVP